MAAIQDILIENLLSRLEEEPDNRVLIRIAHDALLEAGRDQEALNLEPCCWLKAKGRYPYEEPMIAGSSVFFFYAEKSSAARRLRNKKEFRAIVPEGLTDKRTIQKDRSIKGAIQDTVDRWLKLSRERRNELWLWEPPT